MQGRNDVLIYITQNLSSCVLSVILFFQVLKFIVISDAVGTDNDSYIGRWVCVSLARFLLVTNVCAAVSTSGLVSCLGCLFWRISLFWYSRLLFSVAPACVFCSYCLWIGMPHTGHSVPTLLAVDGILIVTGVDGELALLHHSQSFSIMLSFMLWWFLPSHSSCFCSLVVLLFYPRLGGFRSHYY